MAKKKKKDVIKVGGEQVYKDRQGNITKVENVPMRELGGAKTSEVQERQKAEQQARKQEIETAKEKQDLYGTLDPERLPEFEKADELLSQQAEQQQQQQEQEQIQLEQEQQGITSMGVSFEQQREQDEQSFINAFLFGPEGSDLKAGTLPIGPAGAASAIPGVAKVVTKARFANVAKKMTIPIVAITSLFMGGILKDLTEGGATERQGAINTYGQMAGDVVEDVSMSLKTPNQALSDLDYLEQQITDREIELKQKSIAKAYLKITGQLHDVQADLADAKNLVQRARNDVFSVQIKEPNAIELAEFIDRRKKFYGIEDTTIEEEFKAIREGF